MRARDPDLVDPLRLAPALRGALEDASAAGRLLLVDAFAPG